MRNPARTAFGAIFRTEVRLNSKRVVPYAMAALCAGNALLWWGWGPATGRALATNSEGFIAGVLPVFSFMTLPLFTAVIMGDPVIRDFRAGVTPLLFSKPVSRAEYLLGKFFGNFFVLACCQAAFPLTLFVLQWFRKSGMIVQPARFVPYFKHFLFLVVVSHLVLAAFYFAVGTLTRNAKIVYALAVSFYPIYITYQVVFLKAMRQRWRVLLDPLVMNWQKDVHGQSDEWMNHHAVSYDADIILSRALMMLIAAAILAIIHARFARAERAGGDEGKSDLSLVNLSAQPDWLYNDAADFASARGGGRLETVASQEKVAIPEVHIAEGWRASLAKLIAAVGVEFRLLRAERSLVVFVVLAIFFSNVELSFYRVIAEGSFSAAYAGGTARGLTLFLVGMIVFYTGEATHRDRELRIEPVLWSAPAPNSVLLLSKFFATLLLTLSLLALVALTAVCVQLIRGHTPVEPSAYLRVYSLILLPGVVFVAAASVCLNVLLRDKYLAYAASIGVATGLFYLYGQGYKHWLYNPLLYQAWTYADLAGAPDNLSPFLLRRLYWLALAIFCLALAHLFFPRKSTGGFRAGGKVTGAGWSVLTAVASAAAAAGLAYVSSAR
ncbi:MAG: ABC transporter permease subunit [Acidobacteria bacterium]|nr:ABC transporter permease subunit [Acidobacteriota bacterium]MCA1642842.1 ABC transporter permease subunit [Acidobacteriota bacterium]